MASITLSPKGQRTRSKKEQTVRSNKVRVKLTQVQSTLALDLALAGGECDGKRIWKGQKDKGEKKKSSKNHLLFAGLIKMPSKSNTPTLTHTYTHSH